jgi:hypothetical protein
VRFPTQERIARRTIVRFARLLPVTLSGRGPARTRRKPVLSGLSDRGGQGARSCCKKAEAPRKSSPTRLLSNHEKPGPDEDRDRRTLAQQSLAFQYRSVLPSLQHDSQIPRERSIYRDCDLRRTHARYPHFQVGLRGRSARLETLERHDPSRLLIVVARRPARSRRTVLIIGDASI